MPHVWQEEKSMLFFTASASQREFGLNSFYSAYMSVIK